MLALISKYSTADFILQLSVVFYFLFRGLEQNPEVGGYEFTTGPDTMKICLMINPTIVNNNA